VREYALELLASACRYFSRRFNTYIGIIAKTLLPSLTGGRYDLLMIDEDLNLQIFSTEKSDFTDIDEISSGTHRQIMLCIRLALSQALINPAIRGPQFILLDDAYAFSCKRPHVGFDDGILLAHRKTA
jgi:DNA repair protein SbcC/Rad50